jgi:endonuclease/exonuclease/phosphatase family metal-dependent hydrolase
MAEPIDLRIMTYNIWNYNDPWPDRRRLIVETIMEADPDIVGLQEIRDDRRYNSLGHHQARQIAERTGLEYQFQPAMIYSKEPRSAEGVCIMSRHQILSTAYLELTKNPEDETDFHQRIVFNGTIDMPPSRMEFFVTHFSLSEEMRVNNALELLYFVNSFNSHMPKFIVGDFNASSDELPVQLLTGRRKIDGQNVVGNLVDLWEEAPLRGRKNTNGGRTNKRGRIDFIFLCPSPWAQASVREVSLLDPVDSSGLKASDHAAVISKVSITPDF